MFITTAAFLGTLYLVALFFQDGLGLSALASGLSTFPEAIGVMVGAQFASRLYARFGPRRVMSIGLVCLAGVMLLLTQVGFTTDLWLVRLIMFALGLAIAHVFVPSQAAAFATISPASTGRASTMFNTARQVGGALGVALLTTVISAVGVSHVVRAASSCRTWPPSTGRSPPLPLIALARGRVRPPDRRSGCRVDDEAATRASGSPTTRRWSRPADPGSAGGAQRDSPRRPSSVMDGAPAKA